MENYYIHSKLRELCIEKKWFHSGSNEQYEKMFDVSTGQGYTLRDLAVIIWVCSEGFSLKQIYDDLNEFKFNLMHEKSY